MKEYIINKITKILNIKEEQIKIEIPSKSSMGDYSIQCANLRNEKYKNPIEISTMIKEKFEDTDFNFSSIKAFSSSVSSPKAMVRVMSVVPSRYWAPESKSKNPLG